MIQLLVGPIYPFCLFFILNGPCLKSSSSFRYVINTGTQDKNAAKRVRNTVIHNLLNVKFTFCSISVCLDII